MHDPVPEQPPPLQPAKTEPDAGVAVSAILVPVALYYLFVSPKTLMLL